MKIIDLSHTISANMPVYPGTQPPVMTNDCTIDETGFLEKKITFYSHTGTHMDAPAHLIKNAKTLDQLPIDHFQGNAVVINIADINHQNMTLADLEPFSEMIDPVEFILINTGWSRFWGKDAYFENYPVLSVETARWLSGFDLKGVGLDTISIDAIDTSDYPVHKLFLNNNTLIIENLTHLEKLPDHAFDFSCFPLKLEDADGSPVRAVAHIP